MKNRFLLLVFALALSHSLFAHDIHISVTEIQYNYDEKKIQCSLKLFIDDLELAIGGKIDTAERVALTDQSIVEYIDQKLLIESKGHNLKIEYLGKEVQRNVVWLYFQYDFSNKHPLIVTNKVLLEEFDDQDNIVHFVDKKKKQSFLLNKEKIEVQFTY